MKKVIDYLKEVDYRSPYVPSPEAVAFVNFIKLVEGGEPENKTPVVHLKILDNIFSKHKRHAIMSHRGIAKALSLDSIVYTDKGIRTIKDIKVGDYIYGEDGKLTKIIAKSNVFNKPMYEIELLDGRKLKVSEDHINVVHHRTTVELHGAKRTTKLIRKNLTTKEILKYSLTWKRKKTIKNPKGLEYAFYIPNTKPIRYSRKELPIDPYTLGLILGDGSINKDTGYVRLHAHKDDISIYRKYIPYSLGKPYVKNNVVTQGILRLGKVLKSLKLNVHGNDKFIPEIYLTGSISQRINLLQGLMDTDGTIYNKSGSCSFTSNSLKLCEGVMSLVQSLGGNAKLIRKNKHYMVYIQTNINIFKLPRKRNRFKYKSRNKIPIINIKKIPIEPSQCIAVDNETHTFLTNGYTVTHNTTLIAEYLFLYIAVFNKIPNFGEVNLAMYVADSAEGGAKNLRKNIEHRYNQSDFLQHMISEISFTDTRLYFKNKKNKEFVVKLYGGQQNIRGTKELGIRPQLVVMDDMLGDQDAKSPTVLENIENNINKAISKALHPTKHKMILIGTPFHENDPLYRRVESGEWNASVYPICEKFPCSKEEFSGSWEDRFPYEYVVDMYNEAKATGSLDGFYQELMLQVKSDEDRILSDDEIIFIDLNKTKFISYYITTDFATSEKEAADYSVISVWGITVNNKKVLVDGICEKRLMDKNVEDLFRLVDKYTSLQVGIEVTGQQGGFVSWIQKEMNNRGVWFNLKEIRPTKNKMTRFMEVLPEFKKGAILFNNGLEKDFKREVYDELSGITVKKFTSKHDDVIDVITQLFLLDNVYGYTSNIDDELFDKNYVKQILEPMYSINDNIDKEAQEIFNQ